MRWGAALAALGNVALAVAPDFGTVVFSYALMSIGFGFARPGFTAGGSLVEGHEQGALAGAVTAVIGAAFVVAPVAGVALYELLAPAPFLLNTALCLALLVYALRSPALKAAKVQAEPGPDLHHP